MAEMARVTKSGGIVCIATEVLLRDDQSHPEFFTRREFIMFILKQIQNLALIGRMHWNVNLDEYMADPIVIPQDATRWRRHVVLQTGDMQWTSAIAFLRKGGREWSDVLRLLPPRRRKSTAPAATDEEKSPYSIGHHLHFTMPRAAKRSALELSALSPLRNHGHSPWNSRYESARRGV